MSAASGVRWIGAELTSARPASRSTAMADSDMPSKPWARASTIDPDDAEAVRVWAEKLGVTEDQVLAAIRAVGSSAGAVQLFLRRN